MPVAIAGMHRSGTSMVTRLLNLCGLYLGEEEDVVSSPEDNPQGFWEHPKFRNINQEILASFSGGWDIPPVLEPGWENSPQLAALNRHASEVIEGILREPVWGWKDPQNSLTLPFWKRIIPDLKIVICLRNPVDVHRSLARRGYASRFFSYNLWLTYNQQLLASTKPEECIVTHYDSFFGDPRAELRRLADFIELDVSKERIQTASQATLADLRHHRATISDFYQMNVPHKVIELYKELCLRATPVNNSAQGWRAAEQGTRLGPGVQQDGPPRTGDRLSGSVESLDEAFVSAVNHGPLPIQVPAAAARMHVFLATEPEFLGTLPKSLAARGNLEAVNGVATSADMSLWCGAAATFSGWCCRMEEGEGRADSRYFFLERGDGQSRYYVHVPSRIQRDDVADAAPELSNWATRFSGFDFVANLQHLQPGEYRLGVVHEAEGTCYEFVFANRLRVVS